MIQSTVKIKRPAPYGGGLKHAEQQRWIGQRINIMTFLEFLVVLVASPLVALLIFGTWRFYTESQEQAPRLQPVSTKQDQD